MAQAPLTSCSSILQWGVGAAYPPSWDSAGTGKKIHKLLHLENKNDFIFINLSNKRQSKSGSTLWHQLIWTQKSSNPQLRTKLWSKVQQSLHVYLWHFYVYTEKNLNEKKKKYFKHHQPVRRQHSQGFLPPLLSISQRLALSLQASGDVKFSFLVQRLSEGRTVILETGIGLAESLPTWGHGWCPPVWQGLEQEAFC